MTNLQKLLRVVAIIAALLAFLMINGTFVMLDQGEDQHWAGFLIISSAQVGTIGLAIAIALAAIETKWAFHLLWISALAVTPLLALFLFPKLWCSFLACGPDYDEFFWEPITLLPLTALATAVGGFYLSKPK